MFIRIKYGDNETLLCNPTCAIINLLTSIKKRTGYDTNTVTVDLTDETGLVQELDVRQRNESASKYLASQSTYILVQKLISLTSANTDEDDKDDLIDGTTSPPQYQYIPLLNNCTELFPDYKLHVHEVEKKKRRERGKSPSPAGVKVTKGTLKPKQAVPRAPSRKKTTNT